MKKLIKRIPELIKETLNNLDEDQQDFQEKYDELMGTPNE